MHLRSVCDYLKQTNKRACVLKKMEVGDTKNKNSVRLVNMTTVTKQYQIGYTTGTFDMPHVNHFGLLRMMKARCHHLIVGVTSDALAVRQKRPPAMSLEQRMCILQNCKYVDEVVIHEGDKKDVVLKKLWIDVIFIGDDYFHDDDYQDLAVPVVFLPRAAMTNSSQIQQSNETIAVKWLEIVANGISGPLLAIKSHTCPTLMKPIHLGALEASRTWYTGNVYQLPENPPPRNWKRIGEVARYPNIAGVNGYRELNITQMLVQTDLTPFERIQCMYEYDSTDEPAGEVEQKHSEGLAHDQKNIFRCTLERARPHTIYWIFQRYYGITLYEWIDRHKTLLQQRNAHVGAQFRAIIKRVKSSIATLQELKIVHGDLHARNILVSEVHKTKTSPCAAGGQEDVELGVCFIDFGWALHSSFTMSDTEWNYYEDWLQNNRDWEHFHSSLCYDFPDIFTSSTCVWNSNSTSERSLFHEEHKELPEQYDDSSATLYDDPPLEIVVE